jgi:cyclic pyranopterin phosphate synthase
MRPLSENYRGEVARRWAFADGAGEIGFVSSVSQPFCSGCNRARLSSEGRLYTCLFATEGLDLRAALRAGVDDAALLRMIRAAWNGRADRYSELRSRPQRAEPAHRRIEMYYIGG